MEKNECERIREELWELDSLDPQRKESLSAHLRDCPECAAEYERITSCKTALRESASPVPGELRERVMASIAGTPQRKRQRFLPVGTIAAALLVLALFGVSRLGELSGAKGDAGDIAQEIAPSAPNQALGDELPTDTLEPQETRAPQLTTDWFGVLAQFRTASGTDKNSDGEPGGFSPDRVTTLYVVRGGNAAQVAALLPENTLRLGRDGDVLLVPSSAQTLPHPTPGDWEKFTRAVSGADGVAILVTAQ